MEGNILMVMVLVLYVSHSIRHGNFCFCQNVAMWEVAYICLKLCGMYLTVVTIRWWYMYRSH